MNLKIYSKILNKYEIAIFRNKENNAFIKFNFS